MNDTIIVAAISLLGTLGGTLGGILASGKLTNFRIEQLEQKVEKFNNVIERTFVLEKESEIHAEKISDLEKRVK